MKDLCIVQDDFGTPHLEVTFEHWRPNAGKQREDQFSDGTLRLIGLFWALLESKSVLLLEEPELSLNSAIVSKLPAIFSQLTRKKKNQVIISTHSQHLFEEPGIDETEILFFEPSQDGTIVKCINEIDEIEKMLHAGFDLSETVMNKVKSKHADELYQLPLFN